MDDVLDQFLSQLKPELNDGFEVLEGVYRCVTVPDQTGWTTQQFKDGSSASRFVIVADVTDVLQGNGNPGRRFWLRYNADEAGLKRLVNDLFTSALLEKVDRSSLDALKVSLGELGSQTLYIRAWGWTPEKDLQGNPIPEEQRQTRQQQAIKSEKALRRLLEKASQNPF